METGMPDIAIAPGALAALRALEGAGYESWYVGGCVRDALIGRPVNDFDIATAASWNLTESILASHGFTVHRTGVKHGTVTATLDGQPVEITTFRADGAYSDGRHPDEVTFVKSIAEDVARRDFTINALAYHPERGLLDLVGGVADLRAKTIRAVGDPQRRFKEDGLRILRGCRFASQLGFSIEAATLQAMKACKMRMRSVAAERITHELDLLLLGDHAHDALMESIDVLGAIMPEVVACKGFDQRTPYHVYDVWEHTAWVVERAPTARLARWAALFHDIGKPGAFFTDGPRGHFYGHAQLSALMAREIMERLLFAPSFIDRVVALVRIHDDQVPATSTGVRRALARLGGDIELFEALIGIKRADALAQSPLGAERVRLSYELEEALACVLEAKEAFTVAQLAIDGNDVMALSVPEGPAVGSALRAALAAVIDGRVENDRAALRDFIENGPHWD